MDYVKMEQIYNRVYSTPPNSPERAARLAELSEEDNAALWDYYSGLCSGRIKRPEIKNKESKELGGLTMNYQQWKALSKSSAVKNQIVVSKFERQNPMTAREYKKRLEDEKKKRSEIMAIKDTRKRHEEIAKNMQLFERSIIL